MALQEVRGGWPQALMSAGMLAGLTLLFWTVSRYRSIDLDEGFYLASSRLVAEGQWPYLDFFFHQSPLVPIVYGAWIKLFGATWSSARGLSALAAAAAGALIFEFVRRETNRQAPAASALALYLACGFVVTWFTIVKTFALTNVLLVAAFVVLCWPPPRPTVLRLIAAGALFGLASAARIYVIALAPVFVIWIAATAPQSAGRVRDVASFLLGCAVGYLPCILLFLRSPDVFLFDNLGFHGLRSGAGLVGDWTQKAAIVPELLIHLRTDDGLQFTALAVVSAVTFPKLRAHSRAGVLALAIAATLALVSLLPTPTFTQYFCLCMPFLIVSATLGVFHFLRTADLSPLARSRFDAAVVVGIALFAASAFPSLRFYLRSYQYHFANEFHYADLSPAHVEGVSKALDRLAEPGEAVVSFWPGFVFQTHAKPLPPFNNDFGWVAGAQLPPETRQELKIGAPSEIEPLFAAHAPRIVVVGNQFAAGVPEIGKYREMLSRYGYAVAESIGDTQIYVYPRN